jgi:hypothetical protein
MALSPDKMEISPSLDSPTHYTIFSYHQEIIMKHTLKSLLIASVLTLSTTFAGEANLHVESTDNTQQDLRLTRVVLPAKNTRVGLGRRWEP